MNKQREKIDELLVEMPHYVRHYTRSNLSEHLDSKRNSF